MLKQTIQKTRLTARGTDGCDLQIYGYLAAEPRGTTILIFPGMGIPGRAYAKVCNALAGRGYSTFVTDLRGTGESGPPPARGIDFNYDTYLNSDWPAVIAAVREQHPSEKLVLGGHSIGAQLTLVYAGLHPEVVDGVLLFTPNTPYYKCYRGVTSLRYRLWFYLLPLLVRALGYFPGDRLGFGGKNAAGVIRDWTYTGRTGLFRGSDGRDLEPAFARIDAPVATLSYEDDGLAPRAAADNLLARLDAGRVDRLEIATNPKKEMGHFGWMRDSTQYIDWLNGWLNKHM